MTSSHQLYGLAQISADVNLGLILEAQIAYPHNSQCHFPTIEVSDN